MKVQKRHLAFLLVVLMFTQSITVAFAAGLLPEAPMPPPTETPLPTPTPAPSEHREHNEPTLHSGTAISSFSFVGIAKQNTVINSSNHEITVTIPQGVSKNNLVAVFSLSDGATANISNIQQTSGVTANDFSQSVSYKIVAENGSWIDWTITVETYPSIGIVSGPTMDGNNQIWKLTIFSDAPSDGNVTVTVYEADVYDKTYIIPVHTSDPKAMIVSDIFAAAYSYPPVDTDVDLDENNDAVIFTKHGESPLVITITGPLTNY